MLYARAQSKRPRTECAHTVWTDGWEEMNGPERAADRPSMRKARISIRWHQAGQARLASSAIEASCRLRQPLRAGFASAARLRTQACKRVVGCRDMRMLRRSYYWFDCGSSKITEAT